MSKVRIGPQEFTVREVEYIAGKDGPGSDWGEVDFAAGEIRIRRDLNPSAKASAVCHEVEHIMLQAAGMKAKGDFFASDREEEQFVCRMEPHRHSFIVQNVGLILWMWQVAGVGPEEHRHDQEHMASGTGGEDR